MIGGIHITDSDFGLDGHSDADVLLHAVVDSLLGATGRGDIGEWFPNTEERWQGADSADLLREVVSATEKDGWRIVNLDCTISAERPKLTSWKDLIRKRLAELLNTPVDGINVKAKSGEQVGPVGRGEAISADVVVLLTRKIESQ
jgi:2-C-methyl-D-erythritol 2,4-cyclodiphosphate synthase